MPLTNDAPANTTPAKVKLSDLSLMEQVRIRAQRQSDRRQSINTSLRSISSHGSGKDRIETFNNSPRTSIVDFGNKSYDSRNRCSRSRRSSISQSLSSILDDGNKRDSLSGVFGSSSTQFERSLCIYDGSIADSALESNFSSKSSLSAPSAVAPPITDDAEYITTKKIVCIVDGAMIHAVSQSLESSLSTFQHQEKQRRRSLSKSPNTKPRSKRRNKRPSKSYERPFEFVQVPL